MIRILVIFLIFFNMSIFAQFAFLYSSSGAEYGKANCVDNNNNYIEAALFQNSINVNPNGNFTLTSRGMIDVALVKYDNKGNLVWGKRFGGTNTTDAPHGVATDSLGNIYVVGYFGNPNLANVAVDFNPNGGNNINTKSGFDAFLAKYDKDGNYVWALGLGNTLGNTEERCWDIYTDKDGNSYICGGMEGSIDFNPLGTPNIKSVTGEVGLFYAKYDKNGINIWANVISANDTSVFYEAYTAIDVNENGDVYIGGNFRGTNVSISNDGNFLLSSNGQTDMFIAKINNQGKIIWAKRIGGTNQDILSPGALRLDNNGYPYITGRISGMVNFNTSGGTNTINSSLFLASYDTSGILRTTYGMTSNPGDGGHRIDFDSKNNIYLAGWINGTVDFDPTSSVHNVTAVSPTADAFIAKYSSSGNLLWINNIGATNSTSNNIAAGLVVDLEDNSYITGQLFGTNSDFDPSPDNQLIFSSSGLNDCFIIKNDSTGNLWLLNTSLTREAQLITDSFQLNQNYPNPFNPNTNISITIPKSCFVTLKVYDILGKEITTLINEELSAGDYTKTFNATNLSSGVYFYKLQTSKFSETKKMILMR